MCEKQEKPVDFGEAHITYHVESMPKLLGYRAKADQLSSSTCKLLQGIQYDLRYKPYHPAHQRAAVARQIRLMETRQTWWGAGMQGLGETPLICCELFSVVGAGYTCHNGKAD